MDINTNLTLQKIDDVKRNVVNSTYDSVFATFLYILVSAIPCPFRHLRQRREVYYFFQLHE